MLDLKNLKNKISSQVIFVQMTRFFGGNIKVFVFALLFLLFGWCNYIWYSYAYNYQWSEEKKIEYSKTRYKEVTFNRKKFQDIIDREQKRAIEYQETAKAEKDIFGINK